MDLIRLIRNKWFLAAFSVFYFGIVWAFFQIFYRKELVLQKAYKSSAAPDTLQVMNLYHKMMQTVPDRSRFDSFYQLAKVLARIERKKELVKVLDKLLKTHPKDRELRLWLAVELHNQGRYREAEKHFVLLLNKKEER